MAGTTDAPETEQTPREDLQSTLEHRERQITAIRRVSDALFNHPNTEEMIRETLKIALEVLRAEAGTVYLYEPKDDTLVFHYVIGGSGEQLIGTAIPASKGIAGSVFRSGVARLDGDVHGRGDYNADVENRYGYHTESMMTVPMKRASAPPIGVMQVLNARFPPFTPRDLEVLEVLCGQAATGIEHFQLIEEARKAEVVNVIGDISHDIKNMLTPILSGVWTLEPMLDKLFVDLDMIREGCRNRTPKQIAQEIVEAADAIRYDYGWMLQNALASAEQVQARTKEIADTVKGETTLPVFECADLNETCELVARTLKTVALKYSVTLALDLDKELPPVECDRRQVYNAIYNLVNNALPETPQGGVVTIRTRQGDPGAENITLQVEDTGRGIPENIRSRLFTNEAITTKPGGTGLGTRIVMGVVRRHNGTIRVESEVGKGSLFTMRLPIHHK